jgi:hypothetical protein
MNVILKELVQLGNKKALAGQSMAAQIISNTLAGPVANALIDKAENIRNEVRLCTNLMLYRKWKHTDRGHVMEPICQNCFSLLSSVRLRISYETLRRYTEI